MTHHSSQLTLVSSSLSNGSASRQLVSPPFLCFLGKDGSVLSMLFSFPDLQKEKKLQEMSSFHWFCFILTIFSTYSVSSIEQFANLTLIVGHGLLHCILLQICFFFHIK